MWAACARLLLCLNLICAVCLDIVATVPLIKRRAANRNDLEVPPPEILRFMRRFGYLEPSPSDSEALYHESAIVEAIKNLQKYGAVNQTGRLDNQTLDLLSKPRCGVPDLEGVPYYLQTSTSTQRSNGALPRTKRFIIGARPWTKRRITYFIANWSLKVSAGQVERDMERAFGLWARYSGLRFVRVNSTAADIIVGFGSRYHGDNYPFDGPGNILGHAYYPYEMGSWGGDLHFDEDENWLEHAADLATGVDFYTVALHELGHSLGLAHSPLYNSIMFPYYKGPEHNTLDADDTLAMYEMYLNKKLPDEEMESDGDKEAAEQAEDAIKASTEAITAVEASTKSRTEAHTEFTPTFQGDYETVRQHKSRYGPYEATTSSRYQPVTDFLSSSTPQNVRKPEPPNICDGHFDAVTMLDGDVHIFKGSYVWKLTEHYTVQAGYPRPLGDVFAQLPTHVSAIDAAYVRPDGAVVLFAGAQYWVFVGSTTLLEDSPQDISNLLGADSGVTKIDAAMLWPKNNYTYLFAGAKFWRYDDRQQRLTDGYPRSIQRWPGIPNHLNAAATLANGKTYFFKQNLYWLYNNTLVRPARGYPRRASIAWLGCARPTKTPLRNFNTTVSFISAFVSTWLSP